MQEKRLGNLNRRWRVPAWLVLMGIILAGAQSAVAQTQSAEIAATRAASRRATTMLAGDANMSYLDNGRARLGVDLGVGGAITWLSKSGSKLNLINSWDWGRQIQMSHYSGPVPFTPGGKQPAPQWKGLGWNPIQVGDHFGNRSKLLEHHNDGKSVVVKCVPMQWPLDNVPADCTFDCTITLDGNAAAVACRMNNARDDRTQYAARGQELPAVYTNGPFWRLMTYAGDRPFTSDKLTQIVKTPEEVAKDKGFPWARWLATENWAALVNDAGWGLGVWSPETVSFCGGFAGKPGAGGPKDFPTGYISPTTSEIIDHNIVHEYRYVLILGTLEEIRAHVYKHAVRPRAPLWRFEKDRRHWHYVDAADGGWPVRGELRLKAAAADRRPKLVSPAFFCPAVDAPKLYLEASMAGASGEAKVYWRRHGDEKFDETRSRSFAMKGDGQWRTCEVDLAGAKGYDGAITHLRIDPPLKKAEGEWFAVRWVGLKKG